jgi:hypothetical protein
MSRKNASITLSLLSSEKASLEALAEKYGFMWGDRPNISAFLKAIANGAIALGDPTPDLRLRAEIAQLKGALKAKEDLISKKIQ